MPCLDKKAQAEYARLHYEKNKKKFAERLKQRRKERITWFWEIKSKLACKCGESHPACLTFHHRNPKEKSHTITQMVNEAILEEKILAEMAKCDVMCENCHRKLHFEQGRHNRCKEIYDKMKRGQ